MGTALDSLKSLEKFVAIEQPSPDQKVWVSEDEDILFPALERVGLDVDRLVFTNTGLIHPRICYSGKMLREDPRLLAETTQEQAVREIIRIHGTGEYTRPDREFPGFFSLYGFVEGTVLYEMGKRGGSHLDYIFGNAGRGAVDGVLEDMHWAVYVAFHLEKLEALEPAWYRITDTAKRHEAVAAVIGNYLSDLVPESTCPPS